MKNFLKKLKNKVETKPLFTTTQKHISEYPIYLFDLQNQIDCEEITRFCLAEKKNKVDTNLPGQFSLNNDVIRTWYNGIPKTNPEIEKLFRIVEDKCNFLDEKYNYFLDQYWYVVYDNDHNALAHNHKYWDYATIFYPNVPDFGSPLMIKNVSEDIPINVKTGSLVIMHGDVMHYVNKSNYNQGQRIAISMNFYKKVYKL